MKPPKIAKPSPVDVIPSVIVAIRPTNNWFGHERTENPDEIAKWIAGKEDVSIKLSTMETFLKSELAGKTVLIGQNQVKL